MGLPAKKHLWLQYNKNKPFVVTAADIYQPICGCSFSLCIIQNIICHFVNTFQPKSLPASVSVWRINALHSACLHFQATTQLMVMDHERTGKKASFCIYLNIVALLTVMVFSSCLSSGVGMLPSLPFPLCQSVKSCCKFCEELYI